MEEGADGTALVLKSPEMKSRSSTQGTVKMMNHQIKGGEMSEQVMPVCQLSGKDGNVFSIIGRVIHVLK